MEGAILVHFTPNGETVNRIPYVWSNKRSSEEDPMKKSLARCKIG
jgi:hypothetical protein